jgi:hypothetical protein
MTLTFPVKLARRATLSVKYILVIIRLWSVIAGSFTQTSLRIQLMECENKEENVHGVGVYLRARTTFQGILRRGIYDREGEEVLNIKYQRLCNIYILYIYCQQ